MAKNNNIQDLLRDVAEAIREKTGYTYLINPQNFSDEILAIKSGSGDIDTSKIFIVKNKGVFYFEPDQTWQNWYTTDNNTEDWTANSNGVSTSISGSTKYLYYYDWTAGSEVKVSKSDTIVFKEYVFK